MLCLHSYQTLYHMHSDISSRFRRYFSVICNNNGECAGPDLWFWENKRFIRKLWLKNLRLYDMIFQYRYGHIAPKFDVWR